MNNSRVIFLKSEEYKHLYEQWTKEYNSSPSYSVLHQVEAAYNFTSTVDYDQTRSFVILEFTDDKLMTMFGLRYDLTGKR